MASLVDALAWAARGFRVFPITPLAKTPAIAAFQTYASNDPEIITAWWIDPVKATEYDYNIGVLCNDMVVIDIDTKKNRGGLKSYEYNEGHFDTLVVETPTGGMHAYFDGPDSKLAVDILPGIDIRSHNGYVLAPGSYVVDADAGIAGEYKLLVDKPLAWVPLHFEALLERPGVRRPHDEDVPLDTPTAIQQATFYLQSQADVAVEGAGGDNITYQVAAKLVRDYALSVETAYELMALHWNERCLPPWPINELWHKIDNADQYASGQTGAALSDVMFNGVTVPVAQVIARPEGLYFGNAADPQTLPPRPWVVERLLMEKSISIIGGAGEAGKSLLSLVLAAHNAVGRTLGPYVFKVPARTVIFNAEDDRLEQSRRLMAICTAYGLDYYSVRNNILIISSDDFPVFVASNVRNEPVANEPHIATLISMCVDASVNLLVLDPFIEMHGCNESDPVQMRFVMAIFRRIAREANISVMLTHHTNKPSGGKERAGDVDTLRGSSSIPNAARVVVTLISASERDRETFGIREDERFEFVRLDEGKGNYMKRATKATWLRWLTVQLTGGEKIGVLKLEEMQARTDAQRNSIALLLFQALEENGEAIMPLNAACEKLIEYDPLYAKYSVTERRRRIQAALSTPVEVEGRGQLSVERSINKAGQARIDVVLT